MCDTARRLITALRSAVGSTRPSIVIASTRRSNCSGKASVITLARISPAIACGARRAEGSLPPASERERPPRARVSQHDASPAFVQQPEGNSCIRSGFPNAERTSVVDPTLRERRRTQAKPPGVRGDVQTGGADRATLISNAGAGPTGICGQARSLITLNRLTKTCVGRCSHDSVFEFRNIPTA